MLLIQPPLCKPGEPPPGIAQLAACLRAQGHTCSLLDANLEGLSFLFDKAGQGGEPASAWSRRALRHRETNLAALRGPALYQQPNRYQQAVREINQLLAPQLLGLTTKGLSAAWHLRLTLGNYQDDSINPLSSDELLRAAEHYTDNIFFPYFATRLPSLLEAQQPCFVGVSLSFLSQALCAFALLGFLKDHYPSLRLLLGGGLISSWMSSPDWQHPFAGLVECCIRGPGEEPLLRLLEKEREKDTVPATADGANAGTSTAGVASRSLFHRQSLYYHPDYSGLPLDEYLSPLPVLPYAASRGCPWRRCNFCPESGERNPYLPVPPEQVIDHLRACCAVMGNANNRNRSGPGFGLIHLLDNALSPRLLAALAGLGAASSGPDAALPAPWYGFVRFDEQLADLAFCRNLRRSGCVLLKLGLESGSDQVLEAMDKGANLDLMSRVLRVLRQAGIATYVYLLFGTPTESLTEARQTMDYVLAHQEAIGFLNLAIYNMPRHSAEAQRFSGATFSSGDLSLYLDFVHPRGWDRRRIRGFLDREFKRQPVIATILRRDPPFFGSNHAAFFGGTFPWQRNVGQ